MSERDSGSAAERHGRVTEIFLAACELEGKRRERFLDEECGADETLRREVEALLDADSQTDGSDPLERPAVVSTDAGAQDVAPAWSAAADVLLGADEPRRRPGTASRIAVAITVLALVLLLPWRLPAPRSPAHTELADVLARADEAQHAGRLDEAESLLRATLAQQIAGRGDVDPDVGTTARRLADLLEARGQVEEATGLRQAADAVAGG